MFNCDHMGYGQNLIFFKYALKTRNQRLIEQFRLMDFCASFTSCIKRLPCCAACFYICFSRGVEIK